MTIDEQIADEIDAFELHRQIHCRVDPMMAAKIASLEELKRIREVQVPEEPVDVAVLRAHRPETAVINYIDTLRDLLKRETYLHQLGHSLVDQWLKRAEAAEAKLAAMLKLGEEPSEEMANEVRGILQILRGMTGATFDKVREHCKYRGDNAELWPVWAMKAEGYVTEQGAAMLIFNIMFAKMAEQAGVKK